MGTSASSTEPATAEVYNFADWLAPPRLAHSGQCAHRIVVRRLVQISNSSCTPCTIFIGFWHYLDHC